MGRMDKSLYNSTARQTTEKDLKNRLMDTGLRCLALRNIETLRECIKTFSKDYSTV